MRITTSALIGLAAVGLLAGCNSQSSSTAAAGGSASAAGASSSANAGAGSSGGGTATSCPQASTVSTNLGISGLATQANKATSSQGHTGYACVYSAGTSIASVTLVNGVTSSFLSSAAQKTKSTVGAASNLKPVSGVGDQAYTYSVSVGSVTQYALIARKGSVEAAISSGASLSKEEALAQAIFTQEGA